ncbi:hypothetical protein IWQ62_002370 [Dispira parvispora]|uniref:HECT-type E3 ubiquitin transferase n=1 Tax=Dispira parvispora TaxID=1520584 RepID=A0A9W8AVU7_9FUNG|nr:hypothetical protein IWQ62_002370 [Dispira parvispora]
MQPSDSVSMDIDTPDPHHQPNGLADPLVSHHSGTPVGPTTSTADPITFDATTETSSSALTSNSIPPLTLHLAPLPENQVTAGNSPNTIDPGQGAEVPERRARHSSTASEFRRALPQYPAMRYTYYQNQSPLPSPSSSMLSFSPPFDTQGQGMNEHNDYSSGQWQGRSDGSPLPQLPLSATSSQFTDFHHSPRMAMHEGIIMPHRRSSTQHLRSPRVYSPLANPPIGHPGSALSGFNRESAAAQLRHITSFREDSMTSDDQSITSISTPTTVAGHHRFVSAVEPGRYTPPAGFVTNPSRRNSTSFPSANRSPLYIRTGPRGHPYQNQTSATPSPSPFTLVPGSARLRRGSHLRSPPGTPSLHPVESPGLPHAHRLPGSPLQLPSIDQLLIYPSSQDDRTGEIRASGNRSRVRRPSGLAGPRLGSVRHPPPALSMNRRQPPPRPLSMREPAPPSTTAGAPVHPHSLPTSPQVVLDTPVAGGHQRLWSYRVTTPTARHSNHDQTSSPVSGTDGPMASCRPRRESSYHPPSSTSLLLNGDGPYAAWGPRGYHTEWPKHNTLSMMAHNSTHVPHSAGLSQIDTNEGLFTPYVDRYPHLTKNSFDNLFDHAQQMGRFENLAGLLENIFGERHRLGKSFMFSQAACPAGECPVNLVNARCVLEVIYTQGPSIIREGVGRALCMVLDRILKASQITDEDLNVLMIALMSSHWLSDAKKYPTALPTVAKIMKTLSGDQKAKLGRYFIAPFTDDPAKELDIQPDASIPASVPLSKPQSDVEITTPDTSVSGSTANDTEEAGTKVSKPSPNGDLPTRPPGLISVCQQQLPHAKLRQETLRIIIGVFQEYIAQRVKMLKKSSGKAPSLNADESITTVTAALEFPFQLNVRYQLVPLTMFYSEAINENLEIKDDFPKFKHKEGFSFCNFPFVLNPAMKSDILKIESVISMRQELQDSFFRAMFVGVNSPYLILEIRRDHIVRDAMCQLAAQPPSDLKKQLKVRFIGEEAVDEGGVQKEFFQLVVRELFVAKYGMFEFNDDTRLCWFTPGSIHDDDNTLAEYRLMGSLIGLAIYNSVILDVHFPPALYKKLMNRPVGLADLRALDPSLAQGLQTLLDYDGDDLEEVFDRTFQVTYRSLGNVHHYDLKPNGANIPLTRHNRHEFVDLYVDFLLNQSVQKQFGAFQEGFKSVCMGNAIRLFQAEELEQLICGSSDLDFRALEEVTLYDGGFTAKSRVIRYFWEVVHAFTDEQKKRLLFFTTGSDRVPIGGLGKLQFVIAKNGVNSDRLPTSHTCFNVLLLCEYNTKEKLRNRLLTALGNAEGFGMI